MAYRRADAEFVGTFVLVFGGGSAVIAGKPIGVLGIAFAFGLSLLVMAYAVGPISGCHINGRRGACGAVRRQRAGRQRGVRRGGRRSVMIRRR